MRRIIQSDDDDWEPPNSQVQPPSSLTVHQDQPKPILYTHDGTPLVKPPIGFKVK
jgi:hypothetical protein